MRTWLKYGLLNACVIIIPGIYYLQFGRYINDDTLLFFITSAFALFITSGILWKLNLKEESTDSKIVVTGLLTGAVYPFCLFFLLKSISLVFIYCSENCHEVITDYHLVEYIYIFIIYLLFVFIIGVISFSIGLILKRLATRSGQGLYFLLVLTIIIPSSIYIITNKAIDDSRDPHHKMEYDDSFSSSRFYNFCIREEDPSLNKTSESDKKKVPEKKTSKEGQFRSQYENGQLKDERNWKDGKPDGLWKDWHENGQLKMECDYKDGSRQGIYKAWYEDGQIKEEKTYVNGEADGLYRQWYKNGQLSQECTLISEVHAIGLFRTWYDNGQIKSKQNLILKYHWEPYADGITQTWHRNGQLKTESHMKDRKVLSSKSWDKDGKPIK